MGLDSAKLQELQSTVGGSGMIACWGYQVWSWGDLSVQQNWASASKPVLSTMLFLAIHEGRCTANSPMSLYHSGGTTKDRTITFHQLANMISGYSRGEGPGAAWAYNDYAINLYGYTLYHEVFGGAPSAVFPSKLSFMQFQDSPVISDGQYGRLIGVSIRDYARIALLWLARGNWNGVQRIGATQFDRIVNQVGTGTPQSTQDGPESWDFESFGGGDDQTSLGPGHYGYNFWVNSNGLWSGVPSTVYQATGHNGTKICSVVPSAGLIAVGIGGAWGLPNSDECEAALQLLFESASGGPVEAAPAPNESWGSIKARFHR